MSKAAFRLNALDLSIDWTSFDYGTQALNRYFESQVMQDFERRIAACFVATHASGQIAGFYTLSAVSIVLNQLPTTVTKKLPRYPTVPAVRMGRLVVDLQFKKQGLGGALLFDALARAARSDIAAYAMVVEAKDETASAFYRHHGFIALPERALTLFLPLATVKDL